MNSKQFINWTLLCYGIASIFAWAGTMPAVAQELYSPDPSQIVNSTQRLTIEQIESLVDSRQTKDALAQLQSLMDLPATALIEATCNLQQAGTQRLQPYQRMDRWCQSALAKILKSTVDQQEYDDQWLKLAEAAQKSIQRSKSITEAASAVGRYRATSLGPTLALMLVDLQLESGNALAATETLMAQFPELTRVNLRSLKEKAGDVSLPWYQAYEHWQQDPRLKNALIELWRATVTKREKLATEVYWRQLTAAALHPELLDYEDSVAWIAQVVVPSMADENQQRRLASLLAEAADWTSVLRVSEAKTAKQPKFDLGKRQAWMTQLERWNNRSDLTPATLPAVGQLQTALPYYPQMHDGKLFVHELNRIRAYDTANGQTWPGGGRDTTLFDSQINSAALIPLGYPLIGSPRAGLAISDGCLYARIGSPVTAWVSRSKSNDGSSFSSLIGLDLDRQGSMLPGFPLRLAPPQFQDAEFEGVPIVSDQVLISAITERDNVGVRRSLAAFDRFSGVMIWRTAALGNGVVVGGDRANLISAAQPFLAGGLIYFNTDLGSIACVDAASGEPVWMSRYQRVHRVQAEYPRPNRFRYRNGNSARVYRGVLYCLPQDCPEVFALDAFTGQLLWSSSETEVADCTYITGFCNDNLIVGGDRVVWLNCRTGRPMAQFPSSTTPGTMNALPQPRGLGQAALIGDRVFMPTSETVYVFAADQIAASSSSSDSGKPSNEKEPEKKAHLKTPFPAEPKLLEQYPTRYCGSEGGVWCYDKKSLVIATPGRLICFQSAE